jgi:hypothetical protein
MIVGPSKNLDNQENTDIEAIIRGYATPQDWPCTCSFVRIACVKLGKIEDEYVVGLGVHFLVRDQSLGNGIVKREK